MFSCKEEDEEEVLNFSGSTIDHICSDIGRIPQGWIEEAKKTLHIVYRHTSHGSQITYGMSDFVSFVDGGKRTLFTHGVFCLQ